MSDSRQCVHCEKCGSVNWSKDWYRVVNRDNDHDFCSRICLVEFIAPELAKVAVVKQWIPTPEEEARMSQ